MKTNQNLSGFTLIELLVVVLIIGILASVALPQYNKAVRKARLAEVATTFNAISKAIDTWLLENGGLPSSYVYFLNGSETLDISIPCGLQTSLGCYTKVGRWDAYCASYGCFIQLATIDDAKGNTGNNKWLNESVVMFGKYGADKEWGLVALFTNAAVLPDVCRLWKGMY